MTLHAASDGLDRDLAALLIGDSRPMRQLRAAVVRLGTSALPVLVTGPTGAGKELVALALHHASRRPGLLVSFNVCALADALFESAIFGHVRGAFTGAVADSPGYLVEADRGTAFFDEIGALPLSAQAKLLRAVELREFRPLGAARDRWSDFRVVSAKNADVEALVRAGRFRADLAERLGGVVLEVPPLADRREDIPALVAHFAAESRRAAANDRGPVGDGRTRDVLGDEGAAEFSAEALALLQRHTWPRNVRQLRHVVERALAWNADGYIDAETIRAALPPDEATHGNVRRARAQRRGGAAAGGQDATGPSHAGANPGAPAGEPDEDNAEAEFQRRRLAAVLRACGGDTARAAAALGVSRATVYRRLARLGLRATPSLRGPGSPDAA